MRTLLTNVRDVGGYLENQLRRLAERYDVIGNVQGVGLFWGLDLVCNRESRTPLSATDLQHMTTELTKEGVLMGSTGRYDNVLKIRPPLIFSRNNADQLISALDRVFARYKS